MSKSIKARRGGMRLQLLCAVLAVVLTSIGSARAEYLDPLDTPAQLMESARFSLLLDVTQAGERVVAVGERGHILFSDDSGQNWTQAQVPVRTQLNAVFFVDAMQGWAVGEDAVILHSLDGGQSWQKQFDDRDADIQGPLLDLVFLNDKEGFAVGVFNKLYHTFDGGKTWLDWRDHAENADEWHLFTIAATGNDTLYITSETGLLFRSYDAGRSFDPIDTGHVGSFHGILARRDEDGHDRILLSGVGGKVFSSSNSGESWHEVSSGTQAGLSGGIWLADGSALMVGADGVLLHVSPDLKTAQKYQRNNGLALSSLVKQKGSFVLVGLGGLQVVNSLLDRGNN